MKNMTKTPQQTLCERLYELLPKKKELVFGCETSEGYFVTKQSLKGKFVSRFLPEKGSAVSTVTTSLTKERGFEIIGQLLTLADVLMAIEKVGAYNYAINPSGLWYRVDEEGDLISIASIKKCDLSKTVDKWSDETCLFLIDILK